MLEPIPNQKTEALLALLKTLKNLHYSFTTISPLSHSHVNARQTHLRARPDNFSDAATKLQSLRDILGWSRPFKKTDIDPHLFDLMQQADILRVDNEDCYSTVRVSSYAPASAPERKKPESNQAGQQQASLLFLHSAYPTTQNDAVFFGPDTYRYLHLIERVIDTRTPDTTRRLVDIGCGAGPGAILMALRFPEAQVFATDINQTALAVTRVNALAAGAVNVSAHYSDILRGVEGDFDVITANPPFLVDKGMRAYRHGGGALGAALSFSMLMAAIPRLQAGGQFILYTGVAINDGVDHFKEEVYVYLNSLPSGTVTWQYQELDPDIFGEELLMDAYAMSDRIAAIALIVTLSLPR